MYYRVMVVRRIE